MSSARKKAPILTPIFCAELEKIRMAVEVFTGARTCFVQIDFNTMRGKVRVGNQVKDIRVDVTFFGRDDVVQFTIGESDNDWIAAAFYESGEVRMMSNKPPGEFPMILVGRSVTDRREEPLFLHEAQRCAAERGVSLEQLLNG